MTSYVCVCHSSFINDYSIDEKWLSFFTVFVLFSCFFSFWHVGVVQYSIYDPYLNSINSSVSSTENEILYSVVHEVMS